jgi:hypothetical protein
MPSLLSVENVSKALFAGVMPAVLNKSVGSFFRVADAGKSKSDSFQRQTIQREALLLGTGAAIGLFFNLSYPRMAQGLKSLMPKLKWDVAEPFLRTMLYIPGLVGAEVVARQAKPVDFSMLNGAEASSSKGHGLGTPTLLAAMVPFAMAMGALMTRQSKGSQLAQLSDNAAQPLQQLVKNASQKLSHATPRLYYAGQMHLTAHQTPSLGATTNPPAAKGLEVMG